ncbi:hypothetical protein Tco_0675178 [Tanacetum coccineum]
MMRLRLNVVVVLSYIMTDVNAPVEQAPALAPPTYTDELILPRIPFTASLTIPTIYIQQFWDTICYDRTDGGYKCQLDEQWFNLTKDTLRDALQITPVNNNKAFSSPLTQDTLINFRALTIIINLCLTGKTSGFERPRAPVLQILWGGKKKATLIVIPSVRFTKLIIFHLQRKHKFHPRPESPLHLPTEEPILGYLKFSAKGTKREVFGMPIPNELITDDIRGADYYDAYLKKVAKHQRYLAGEEVSDPDSPAPKPAKSTKPKITKQAKPVAPKAATKKPQPAPTKPKEKKRKQAKETTEATPPAKRAKAGKVAKKRTLKRSQQLVDEFVDEGIPLTEPGFGDLEADTQRAIEESLKDAHGAHRGPLPPVVFRETDTGKFLKGQELQCCRFFGASSIELISIMRKGCGKNSLNPSIPSRKTKRIWHNTLRERRKPLSFAKGTKREVFGMPIPNELITDDIRGADYYDAYLKKVAKHQRYLAGEEVSDPDSPAPKPAKSTKPKITKQAKPVAPKAATKKPQPAPTKPKEKKPRKVAKKRTLKRSQQLVDEFVDEGIPLTEPGFGDLEADTQRAIEESLKDAHGAHRGPLPPVVFRETNTGKFQPLPEVEGKGKEKVGAEQAARVLLNLQTPKKKSPTKQYIFQRRTSTPTEPSGHAKSSSLYVELGLTKSDTESDEEVPPVVKSGAPDEGQQKKTEPLYKIRPG